MAFRPTNIVIIDNAIYYSNKEGEVGLIEEEPTMQLAPDNTVNGQNVTVLPIPRLEIQIPRVKLPTPINFTIGNNEITVSDIHAEGGEGIIYKGILNRVPVILKTYIKRPRTLPRISPYLRRYVPTKYLLFEDASRAYFVIMEELDPLVYTTKIFKQSREFLTLLEQFNIRHGDISPGNIMQDGQGNLKLIDFARQGALGTRFYSKDNSDRKAMALSLLSHKYSQLIGEYLNNPKPSLYKLYIHYTANFPLIRGNQKANMNNFFSWFKRTFPQDNESIQLILEANAVSNS